MTGTVQAIARASRTVQHGWDSLSSKHLCPGCGRLMGLTRTVPASSGYSELRTYGCKECGVWVTEGSSPGDELGGAFA